MAAGSRATKTRRLIAIHLVTRSRPGPKLVFHYPPNPKAVRHDHGVKSNDPSDLSDDFSDADAESGKLPPTSHAKHMNGRRTGNNDPAPPNTILGFSEDSLEKLLSPGCWCDRKKFEVSLDGLTYVGHPIYAAYDGSWDGKHTHGPAASKQELKIPTSPTATMRETEGGNDARTKLGITITEPQTPAKAVRDFTHVAESLESQGGLSMAASINSSSTVSAVAPEQLTMFNVIFVLARPNSRLLQQEASEMYQHIAKQFSKALHYCQRQTSYVGTESKKLLALKAKAKQEGLSTDKLWSQMLESSELAWALKEVYEKISVGEIAGIRLNGMEMSLRCPTHDESETHSESNPGPHCGLLLLEEKDVLLRELAHFQDASPLAYFIREHTPTKSLQKHAVKLGMPIYNILWLARHLIKWRKVLVIPPLHARNVYMVGLDAPVDNLADHVPKYAHKFSALPDLPQMLKMLSGKPIRYGMLVPSRDHRAPYMEILAYLVQHKFVQQLRTFGWLQAVPGLKKKAEVEPPGDQNRRPLSVVSLLSPQLRPIEDDIVSVSSERTAIPVSAADNAKRESNAIDSTTNAHNESGHEIKTLMIVTNPLDPTAEQAECLEKIRDSINDDDLRNRFPSLVRYFNGEKALEDIAANEGLKRSRVDAWLETLQNEGFLLTFRHL